jgi:hypothetical protein
MMPHNAVPLKVNQIEYGSGAMAMVLAIPTEEFGIGVPSAFTNVNPVRTTSALLHCASRGFLAIIVGISTK